MWTAMATCNFIAQHFFGIIIFIFIPSWAPKLHFCGGFHGQNFKLTLFFIIEDRTFVLFRDGNGGSSRDLSGL